MILEQVKENGYTHVNGDEIMDSEGKDTCWLWNNDDCIDNSVYDSGDSSNFEQ